MGGTMSTEWTYLPVAFLALAFITPSYAAEDATTGAIDTRIGKIDLDKGLPANAEVEQKIYDELDFQRATQAYIWALPVVAFEEWQKANRQVFGASPLCHQPSRSRRDRPLGDRLPGRSNGRRHRRF